MGGCEGRFGTEDRGIDAGGYGVQEEEIEPALVWRALRSRRQVDLPSSAVEGHKRRKVFTSCVDKFRCGRLQAWNRDTVPCRKSNQFCFCVLQNTVSRNLLVHSPPARRAPCLTMKMDCRRTTDLAIQPLHVNQCAQRQRWFLGLGSFSFGELEILMVPHVVMDYRLRETLGENKGLLKFETNTYVNKTMDIACARSARASR